MDEEIAVDRPAEGRLARRLSAAHLKKIIEKDRSGTRSGPAWRCCRRWPSQYRYLGDLLSQSQIIRFEIVDAQRVDYEFKMQNPDVDVPREKKVDFATSKDIIYWPFNGEFWEDELGYYRYTEHGSCK